MVVTLSETLPKLGIVTMESIACCKFESMRALKPKSVVKKLDGPPAHEQPRQKFKRSHGWFCENVES